MVLKLHNFGSLGSRFAIPLHELAAVYDEVPLREFSETPNWLTRDGRLSLEGLGLMEIGKRQKMIGMSNLEEM